MPDEGAIADLQRRSGSDRASKTKRRLARKLHTLTKHETSTAGQIGELFHLKATPNRLTLAAEQGFIPHQATDLDQSLTQHDVQRIQPTKQRLEQAPCR